MPKKIDKIGMKQKIYNIIEKVFDFLMSNHFSIDLFVVVFLLLLYFFADNPGFDDNITAGQETFINLSYTFFILYFTFYAFELFLFKIKISRLKTDLKIKGFEKYIEYQYQKNDESFFNGIGYITTIFIAIIAIGVSFMGMQVSYDIASSVGGNVTLDGTGKFSGFFGGWLGVISVIIILFFGGYKFHKLSKRNFLEKIFLGQYLKKNKKL